ncbi:MULTISPECIES: hypothetical protein [Streptomyces]|uniref:Uncharacterized protein n=2 Tax=Streptomyces TaxID=1883 RepID=A0ABS9JNR7_9ACTN|nr:MULTISPECIES: hypothetical protein [Streptomyces]MCG0067202.1 hypothetical protein [Streptomyces tricolor]MYU28121.1 hypothetical protein [Streptomyces sp. SID7810]OYP18894.1 hypothetical protein CFC35_34015 [Streptomyces sp. FBKL.4005]
MLLVHLTLDPPPGGEPLPPDIGCLIRACATREDRLEHVAVHAAAPWPVVGVFLCRADLMSAEAAAERLWWRAVARRPRLAAWRLRRAEVPLLRPELLGPEVLRPDDGHT